MERFCKGSLFKQECLILKAILDCCDHIMPVLIFKGWLPMYISPFFNLEFLYRAIEAKCISFGKQTCSVELVIYRYE